MPSNPPDLFCCSLRRRTKRRNNTIQLQDALASTALQLSFRSETPKVCLKIARSLFSVVFFSRRKFSFQNKQNKSIFSSFSLRKVSQNQKVLVKFLKNNNKKNLSKNSLEKPVLPECM